MNTPSADAGLFNPIFNEIKTSLNHKLWQMATTYCLILPDICGALESAEGMAKSKYYKKWFDEHLKKYFRLFTSDACYKLRCGMVHSATARLQNTEEHRVLFVPPNSTVSIHDCIADGALIMNIEMFCSQVCNEVKIWYEEARFEHNVIKNAEYYFRLHPNGLHPFIVGLPVIA